MQRQRLKNKMRQKQNSKERKKQDLFSVITTSCKNREKHIVLLGRTKEKAEQILEERKKKLKE